jgi:hypothetical protein
MVGDGEDDLEAPELVMVATVTSDAHRQLDVHRSFDRIGRPALANGPTRHGLPIGHVPLLNLKIIENQ